MSSDLESNLHQINLDEGKRGRPTIYEFGDYRLDAEHLMLYRQGSEIALTPKQVETLLALVEKNGEIVSKDMLMQRLWGDAAVEESNLIQNVYILRKILGQTLSGKPIIETLRRRGYRFNAPTRIRNEADARSAGPFEGAKAVGVSSQAPHHTIKLSKVGIFVIGLVVLIAGSLVTYLYRLRSNPRDPVGPAAASAARRGTTSDEAYSLHLQAMTLYARNSPNSTQKAIELLDRAVELDPNYAVAWAGKALAHRFAANLGPVGTIREHYERSMDAAKRALALDPGVPEAYSAICENRLFYEYDLSAAEAACKKALELDPNSTIAHEMYSRVLTGQGRSNESITEIKTAIDLEPNSLFNQRNLGSQLFFAKRYDEAAAQFRRVMDIDPQFFSAYQWLSSTLQMQGKDPEAFDCFLRSEQLRGVDEVTLAGYQATYQGGGMDAIWIDLARQHPERNGSAYIAGAQQAHSGRVDEAFESLERSFQQHEWGFAFLKVDPRFDSIRSDTRYAALASRLKQN